MGLIAKLRTSDICWIAEKSLTALVKSKSPMPTNVQKPTKAKCWRNPDRSNRCSRKKSKPLGSKDFCFFFFVTGVKSLSRPQRWAHRTRAIVRQMKKPWRGTEGNEDIRHVKTCRVKNMNLWKLKFDTALLSNSHPYNPSLRPQIFWLLAFGLVDPWNYPCPSLPGGPCLFGTTAQGEGGLFSRWWYSKKVWPSQVLLWKCLRNLMSEHEKVSRPRPPRQRYQRAILDTRSIGRKDKKAMVGWLQVTHVPMQCHTITVRKLWLVEKPSASSARFRVASDIPEIPWSAAVVDNLDQVVWTPHANQGFSLHQLIHSSDIPSSQT